MRRSRQNLSSCTTSRGARTCGAVLLHLTAAMMPRLPTSVSQNYWMKPRRSSTSKTRSNSSGMSATRYSPSRSSKQSWHSCLRTSPYSRRYLGRTQRYICRTRGVKGREASDKDWVRMCLVRRRLSKSKSPSSHSAPSSGTP